MAVSIIDDYPPMSAAGGSCYCCKAGRRDVRDPDGTLRRERVVDLEQNIDFEGHLMICESCVREAAAMLGMVDASLAHQWLDEGQRQVAIHLEAMDEAVRIAQEAVAERAEARAAVDLFLKRISETSEADKPKPRAKAKASA